MIKAKQSIKQLDDFGLEFIEPLDTLNLTTIKQFIRNHEDSGHFFVSKRNQPIAQIRQFNYVSKWTINSVVICQQKLPQQFVRTLFNIKFQYLQILSLLQCSITSIQTITRLHCPSLIKLDINRNLINSIKTLRKFSGKQLSEISFDKNWVMDIRDLAQAWWISMLKSLKIQQYFPQSNVESEKLELIPKIPNLQRLYVRSQNRIRSVIRSPNPQLQIFDKQNTGFMVSDGESDDSQ